MIYPKKVYFENCAFDVDKHVYEPAEDSFLVAEKIAVTDADTVLDLGTGCGILAIIAAKKAKHVVAVDINPFAIKCARNNAKTCELTKKIDFFQGNLFNPIKYDEKFSLILFNSPYLPSEPGEENTWIGKAWAGGPSGRKVIDQFIKDVPKWLTENGKILLVQSSLSNHEQTIEMFSALNLEAKIISQMKFPFESIILIEAKRLLS